MILTGSDMPTCPVRSERGQASVDPVGPVPVPYCDVIPHLRTRRDEMKKIQILAPVAAVAALTALGGCATKGDVEQLRSEIAGLRSSIERAAGALGG